MGKKQNIIINNSIESPCIRNCCLNENDICMGCFRHVDEIIEWGQANNTRRCFILKKAKQRQMLLSEF